MLGRCLMNVPIIRKIKMAVRLLFPTYVFERDLLDPNLSEYQGCTQEYFDMLKDEMDTMRVRDPEGRRISNAYTGWQSNDGVERHPTFTKVLNRIERLFIDEVLPFHGYHEGKVSMKIGNSWAKHKRISIMEQTTFT